MISWGLFEEIMNVSIHLEILSNIIKISGYAVIWPIFEAATSWMQEYGGLHVILKDFKFC